MRLGENGLPTNQQVRHTLFRLTNPRTGKKILRKRPIGDRNAKTGRIADMSPGAAVALGLTTDQTVQVEMIS